jgi:hypothetical protein
MLILLGGKFQSIKNNLPEEDNGLPKVYQSQPLGYRKTGVKVRDPAYQ